jgi:hypothetical protein
MSKLNAKYIDDIFVEDSAAGDGSTTTYALTEKPFQEENVKVFLNGVKQIAGETTSTRFNGGGAGVAKRYDSTSNDFKTTGDFTFALWINPADSTGQSLHNILGHGNKHDLRRGTAADNLTFRIFDSVSGSVNVDATGTFPENNPYFVVLRYNSTLKRAEISVNDSAYAVSGSLANGIAVGGTRFWIGAGFGNDSNGYDGLMDQVMFFSNLISDQTKTELFNNGNGQDYSTRTFSEWDSLGLVSSYSMDQLPPVDEHGSNNLSQSGTGTPTLEEGIVVSNIDYKLDLDGASKDIIFYNAPAIAQDILVKYIKE